MTDELDASGPAQAQPTKSASAFRTISEVAGELDVPQHVLRFWETKFSHIRPMKRGGGRRYYRPEDVRLLRRIRDLLYTDGFTIRGVQRLLREHGVRAVVEGVAGTQATAVDAAAQADSVPATRPADPPDSPGQREAELRAVLAELRELRALLA